MFYLSFTIEKEYSNIPYLLVKECVQRKSELRCISSLNFYLSGFFGDWVFKREIFEKIPDLPVFNLKVTFNSDFFYHADRGNKNT